MSFEEQILIRPLREGDSLEDLTELLHRAYKSLAEMGLRFLATHQSVETTIERITGGTCYVAEQEGRVIGTITWYRGPNMNSSASLYRCAEVASFGQFGVEPEFRRLGIGRRLLDRVEADARASGFAEIALDTAEGATHLIEWYQKLGYQFVEYAQWDVTNYRSVIMSKTLEHV